MTRFDHNLRVQVTHTWGDVPYPVRYVYDSYGRLNEMHTWQLSAAWDGVSWPAGVDGQEDVTTWNYQEGTGLLTSKTDDAGESVSYTYTDGGRLDTRTWARGGTPIVTTYGYDPDTSELLSIDYSDSTPDVTFTYDRLGRQDTITDALGSRTFAYNPSLQLETETISGLINKTITRTYEAAGVLGRSTGLNTGVDYGIGYDYDNLGRFDHVDWTIAGASTEVADYTFEPNSDLIHQIYSYPRDTVYTYEPNRNLITQVSNEFESALISQYDYEYDELGRREWVKNGGSAFAAAAFNLFDYNPRSELHESARYLGTDETILTSPVTGEFRDFTYDPIGNRENVTVGTNGGSYITNNLNQYSTENVAGGGTNTFTHDEDGNLTQVVGNKNLIYTYDAENRLIFVEPSSPVIGDKKLTFVYDYMGRRIYKNVSEYTFMGLYSTIQDNRFIYDGWNVIEEIIGDTSPTAITKYYVWGLDLSQSLQGAGGIGGLLAQVEGTSTHHFLYDGNGNVSQMMMYMNPTIQAHYEYDAFGNIIISSGPVADVNPFRFSTKYLDPEFNLYYYGYRYYDPETGRWLSRDPVEEEGGLNLYEFAVNDSINHFDRYGNVAETLWDIISVGAGIVELVVAPSWIGAGALIVDIGAAATPFVPGGASAALKANRLANIAAKAGKVDKIKDAAKVLVKAGKGSGVCRRATVVLQKMPYKQLVKIKNKMGLGRKWHAHHIIEKRFHNAFRVTFKQTDEWMAVAVDPKKHAVFTKRWRDAIPLGSDYANMSKEYILKAARKVYRDAPEILRNLSKLP